MHSPFEKCVLKYMNDIKILDIWNIKHTKMNENMIFLEFLDLIPSEKK